MIHDVRINITLVKVGMGPCYHDTGIWVYREMGLEDLKVAGVIEQVVKKLGNKEAGNVIHRSAIDRVYNGWMANQEDSFADSSFTTLITEGCAELPNLPIHPKL